MKRSFLFVLLALIFLTACGGRRETPTALPPTSLPVMPTPTASRTPSPTPSLAPTQTLELGATPTSTNTPTNTPVPVTTPQGSAEDYQLKAWDYPTALRVYAEAGNVPIAEEYADLRRFYQLSLLEELYLSFPNTRSDPGLLRDMANFKGLVETYWAPYGLLHDHGVEPFRRGLEQALNNGSAKLPELMLWGETVFTESEYTPAVRTTRLFDGSTPARVLKVTAAMGWNFFVLRENADGSYSVFALYPEWKRPWWNEETFQITDLNGNGREEVAITYEGWGSGFAHFCEEKFFLYEWDGQAFRDLINSPLNVIMGTDYGNCLGITFQPDTAGRKLIRAGTSRNTYCEDYPYLEPITYGWNGKGFIPLAGSTPVPPGPREPDKCTIGWAIAAGADNDSAVKLLAAAVANWPADAAGADEEVWGPATHDYFKMELATWYMQRGQVQRGVDLLKQVRDAPAAPEFHFASQVAAAFLETYETKGIYQAVQAVWSIYKKERESVCGYAGCNTEKMRKQWGFTEPEWGYAYSDLFWDDFLSIDAMSLDLNKRPPGNLEDFRGWLKKNGLSPVWAGEANADGQGQSDWLAEFNAFPTLFMRQNNQLSRVKLSSIYVSSNNENRTHRWETFRPGSKAPVIDVYQVGTKIYAFHILQEKGTYRVVMDLDSSKLSLNYDYDPLEVQDWSVQEGKLIVQYDGSEGVYIWDDTAGKLVPTGYAPDRLEENIALAERAIYIEEAPEKASDILTNLFNGRIGENYVWMAGGGYTNPPRVRPYAQYLLGLAYERGGDPENATRAYWQLWHDFPSSPYSLAAQSKLKKK